LPPPTTRLPLISRHRARRQHHRAPQPLNVPAITPAYNWGGIYFGFNLGYGFGTSNWTDPN
jgi:hypothetical protein